jgi:hypothetical protein
MADDPALLGSPAQEDIVPPLEPAAEVDQECSDDIFALFGAVWSWDGGLGG